MLRGLRRAPGAKQNDDGDHEPRRGGNLESRLPRVFGGADQIEETGRTLNEDFAPYTKKYFLDLARQHAATAVNHETQRDGHARSLELYDRMIAQRTQDLHDLLALYSEYSEINRELTRATNNYSFLLDKQNEARLRQLQAERLGYIQIIEPARKPDAPVASKTVQLVLVGGVVSVLIGFVLSFLLARNMHAQESSSRLRVFLIIASSSLVVVLVLQMIFSVILMPGKCHCYFS